MRDVRAVILREATRLFGQQGFGATSVREVVAAAGVTKPTLYYYFASKDSLFVEAVGAQVALLRQIVEQTLCADGPPLQRLADFVHAYVDAGLGDPDGVRLMMTARHPGHEAPQAVDLLATYQEAIAALAGVLVEARNCGQIGACVDQYAATLALLGSCNLYISAALDGLPLPKKPASALLDLFLHGVVSR